MSSILDALEKLERREASLRESAAPAHPPARRGWTAAAVLVAFVAGGGIAFSLRTGARLPEPTLTAARRS